MTLQSLTIEAGSAEPLGATRRDGGVNFAPFSEYAERVELCLSFALATVAGREEHGFCPRRAIFQAIAQDPVLARGNLIAEPWDLRPGGCQHGNFNRNHGSESETVDPASKALCWLHSAMFWAI